MLVYKRELRANCRSMIIWCAGILFLIFAGMGKYEAGIAAGGTSMMELFDTLPDSLKNIFGLGVFDVSRVVEYYAVLFLYIALILSLYAAILGASIITKEERDRTSEFLLVKPISRTKIMTEKILAALTMCVVVFAVTYAFSVVTLLRYEKLDGFAGELFLLMSSGLALQLLFLSLGVFFGGMLKKPKLASALAAGILLFMYFISMIVDLSKDFQMLRYLSFFKYYDPKDILILEYWPGYPVVSTILVAIFICGAFFFYRKRDMKI